VWCNVITVGVVSDTHIPDRVRQLNPQVISIFREAGVQAILHAGDVSTSATLEQLKLIAPVHTVRGNRDWVAMRHLPSAMQISLGGVKVGIIHGHGPLFDYMRDRLDYILNGYRLEMFEPRLLAAFPDADVIVFGHTHRALNHKVGGKLIFNPGSPHFPDPRTATPSVGLLHISAQGMVEGEIRTLTQPV